MSIIFYYTIPHIISVLCSYNFVYDLQMDGIDSRPRSMEGPIDSGISINGDNISSPDSDNSSQHIQNQIVSICLNIYHLIFCI